MQFFIFNAIFSIFRLDELHLDFSAIQNFWIFNTSLVCDFKVNELSASLPRLANVHVAESRNRRISEFPIREILQSFKETSFLEFNETWIFNN